MEVDQLQGVWILTSFVYEDLVSGARTEPFGARPSGTILFHPDGRFFALMTPGERQPPRSERDQADAFQSLIAYSGPYRLEPPNRLVTVVDIAWFEPWIGSEQVRFFTLEGDTLELVSAPLRLPRAGGGEDTTVFARVSWRREHPRTRPASPH